MSSLLVCVFQFLKIDVEAIQTLSAAPFSMPVPRTMSRTSFDGY
jgi:hypothetical protein